MGFTAGPASGSGFHKQLRPVACGTLASPVLASIQCGRWLFMSPKAGCRYVLQDPSKDTGCHRVPPNLSDSRVTNDLEGIRGGNSQRSDLRFWVELRGFEPLTPSMRTERAAQQIPSCSTLPQVSGRFLARITASDRTCQRLTAPSSLLKSDTGPRSARPAPHRSTRPVRSQNRTPNRCAMAEPGTPRLSRAPARPVA